MAVKRLHFYDQQFLVEADFTDEQKYHVGMRRRLNTLLHTFGIAHGLDVVRSGERQVTVTAGAAVDSLGRELILETNAVVDLSNLTTFPASAPVFVSIVYQEQQTDPSTATGAPGNTRISEAPVVQASTSAPPTDGTVVRLARFDKKDNGDVPGNNNDVFDGGVRQSVSAKLGKGVVAEANLSPALAAKVNTPTGIVSLHGVSNPGGNVTLQQANAITITADDPNNRITIGETHSTVSGNPHGTTAAQVGAVPAAGGAMTGNLQINASLGINTAPSTRLHVSGATPAVRIVDGNQAAGRLLVSDVNGNATWKDNSRYFVSGGLAVASINATTTAQRMGDFLVFAKASAESTVEVTLNSRAQSGVFSGASSVKFEIRIDNVATNMANEAAINSTSLVEFIGIFAVFQGLAAGNHTVSVWVRTNSGTSTGVLLDPGGYGGRIIAKETF